MGIYLGSSYMTINTTRAVDFYVIESLTEPISTRQGAIWIKRAPTEAQVAVRILDYVDPAVETVLEANSLYLYIDSSAAFAEITISLFEFTEYLSIDKTFKCSILTNSASMQKKTDVYIYDLESASFVEIPFIELPIYLGDDINLSSFLGTGVVVSSLFTSLGILESASSEATVESNTETIDLESFLGTAVTITSLFTMLGIVENVTVFTGGDQVYPPLE